MLQKLYASAVRDSVKDDPYGVATFWPAAAPGATDISTTPNRMLQSYVAGQASISPSVISIDSSQKPATVKVRGPRVVPAAGAGAVPSAPRQHAAARLLWCQVLCCMLCMLLFHSSAIQPA